MNTVPHYYQPHGWGTTPNYSSQNLSMAPSMAPYLNQPQGYQYSQNAYGRGYGYDSDSEYDNYNDVPTAYPARQFAPTVYPTSQYYSQYPVQQAAYSTGYLPANSYSYYGTTPYWGGVQYPYQAQATTPQVIIIPGRRKHRHHHHHHRRH